MPLYNNTHTTYNRRRCAAVFLCLCRVFIHWIYTNTHRQRTRHTPQNSGVFGVSNFFKFFQNNVTICRVSCAYIANGTRRTRTHTAHAAHAAPRNTRRAANAAHTHTHTHTHTRTHTHTHTRTHTRTRTRRTHTPHTRGTRTRGGRERNNSVRVEHG